MTNAAATEGEEHAENRPGQAASSNMDSLAVPSPLPQRLQQRCRRWAGWAAASMAKASAVAAMAIILWVRCAAAQAGDADFSGVAAAASTAQQQHDIPRAIALYRRAVELNPKYQDGWWFLGTMQYGTNDFADARDALTHFIELKPEAGPAYAVRGLCEFETGEYDQSLSDIQRGLIQGAANQTRNTGILRYHEVLLLSQAGRFEEALTASVPFSEGEAAPEIVLAVGLAGLRVRMLPREVPQDSPQRELYLAAGNAALRCMSGDADLARLAFQDLFQRFPNTPNAHYLYGYLLFGKDPDRAISEFKSELQISPANASAEAMLGWAYLVQEDYADARIFGAKAVEQAPRSAAAQLVLGRALVETGDMKTGVDHLQTALGIDPKNLEIHLALVRAYSKSGLREQALRERQQCLLLTSATEPPIAQP